MQKERNKTSKKSEFREIRNFAKVEESQSNSIYISSIFPKTKIFEQIIIILLLSCQIHKASHILPIY